MRDDRERLRDVLEAIERIEKYASAGRVAIHQDELVETQVSDRMIRFFRLLTRAARNRFRAATVRERNQRSRHQVVHHPMIVGEACRALSAEFRAAHPEEVWAQAAGLRNVIVHEQCGIDHEVVWGVMERDLPDLKLRVLKALDQK